MQELQAMIRLLQRQQQQLHDFAGGHTTQLYAPFPEGCSSECDCGCRSRHLPHTEVVDYREALSQQGADADFPGPFTCFPFESYTSSSLPPEYHNSGRKRKYDNGSEEPSSQLVTKGNTRRRLEDLFHGDQIRLSLRLGLFNECIRFKNMYNEYLYAICPIHPAAIDTDNIKHIVTTDEGAEEISPLSISVNIVIAIGA